MTDLMHRLDRFPLQTLRARPGAITFRAAGAGYPVVLLHGIGSGSASWLNQYERLGSHLRVVAWDAPGYGGSAVLERDCPTARDYAAALQCFIEALGLDCFHLVGHSLGAIMAAAYCRHFDEGQVRSLTLADPAIGYARQPEEVRRRKTIERIETMNHLGPKRLARSRAPNLLSSNTSPAALRLVEYSMARLRPEGYIQAVRMLESACLLDDAIGVEVPVLVICGTEDRITPPAMALEVMQAYAGARYVAIPQAGHASYVEQPQMFCEALGGFLPTCAVRHSAVAGERS